MDPGVARSPKLTVTDYLQFPEDGLRHELVDGVHVMNPSPNIDHQAVLRELFAQLYQKIQSTGLGDVFVAPTDVELSATDVVVPDLLVVLAGGRAVCTKARIVGAPDLVVEIISPSDPQRDRQQKRDLYQRSGVREYWIVDPMSRSLEQFIGRDGRFGPSERHDEVIELAILPGASIDLRLAWRRAGV